MQKEISSSYTFLTKVLFPCIWIPASSFVVLRDSFSRAQFDWLLLLGWIGGTIVVLWFSYSLKSVRIADDLLYIKDYLKEISTPAANICDVGENMWSNPKTITLSLRDATEFGDQITFLSQMRFWPYRGTHPTVNELKKLAKLEETST